MKAEENAGLLFLLLDQRAANVIEIVLKAFPMIQTPAPRRRPFLRVAGDMMIGLHP